MKAALALAAILCALPAGAETAVYLAHGRDASLFGQYDVNGFSVEAFPERSGVKLVVRTEPSGPERRSLYAPDRSRFRLPIAPDRDALAASLSRGKTVEREVEKAILGWVSAEIAYDPDRRLPQDPVSVFGSRRAYCVGFAELAVDLLRRVGLTARTVQGVLRTGPDAEGYDSHIGGVYHRWIEVYYADRGFVFSDPSASINGVDARYIPFGRRELERPRGLTVTSVETSGTLDYPLLRLPQATLRVRRIAQTP